MRRVRRLARLFARRGLTTLGVILILALIVAFFGVGPFYGWGAEWGYTPSGVVFFLFLVVVFLALTGRL
jgi:low affinity Fe/Cu permease